MSDTSAIRNALNGHVDKQNQGDSATLRSTLTDSFYNSLDQVYALPYADNTPSVPTKVQTTTPAPTQPTQPAITYKPNAAPTQPQTQAGGNWFSNIVDQFTTNMKQGTDTLHDIPGLPDVIEPVGGALWAGANTIGGLFGDVTGAVGGGLNALDERMAADENAGQLPTNYKPFTEQVADIAGQYNERIANPIAGYGAKTLGTLASGLPNYTKENPTQNLLTAPTVDTQQTMDRAWKDLLSGNVIGAVDNGLRSFGDYGNEQFAQLDPKAALLASLIFDPLNFLPGAGIGEAQKAGKLGELTKGVARIEEAADLLPKGIMGRIGTPVAKVTEALNTGLKSLWHNTADLTNADEYFGTMRAFETAGKDTKSFEQVLKTYAGLDTVPAQRIEKFMQGVSPHIDEVETAFRTVERGLQTGEDMGKLPKNFARFVEDVKAGKTSSSDLFEFTKAEMISRLQDEMAKNSAKLYPLKNASAPANIANRFLNNLKGFEALVYIGLSPITFVRNIVNGLTTMAIEGVNPFFSATGEIARLRKLGQVERAADLQRAMKFHETLLNTGGLVRQAYGQGQFATGATGPLGSFMSKMIHGSPLGKPLQWYQNIENGMRSKVWTGTYYNVKRHNVDKVIGKMDAMDEAILHQYRVPTSDVTNVIKEGLLTDKQPGAIMRDLNDLMDGKRATSIDWSAVADEMGVPREHLNALLDEHDQAKAYQMAQEIAARVAQGEDKAAVVEEVVAQAASEATQATAERIGIDLGGDLESQRGELISRWNDASKLKGAKARAEADALFEQIAQIEDEMKARSAKPPEASKAGTLFNQPEPDKGWVSEQTSKIREIQKRRGSAGYQDAEDWIREQVADGYDTDAIEKAIQQSDAVNVDPTGSDSLHSLSDYLDGIEGLPPAERDDALGLNPNSPLRGKGKPPEAPAAPTVEPTQPIEPSGGAPAMASKTEAFQYTPEEWAALPREQQEAIHEAGWYQGGASPYNSNYHLSNFLAALQNNMDVPESVVDAYMKQGGTFASSYVRKYLDRYPNLARKYRVGGNVLDVGAMASPLDENPLPPVDLPTAQLSPSQEKARAYLLTLTKADGSPLYTAEQLATWKPDSIDRIAGELQTARVTMDDVLKVAKGKGIATATDTGRPNNRHLLNVLNKHRTEGAAEFRTIDDVKARADEARKILEGYAPEAKPVKAVAPTSAEVGAVDRQPVVAPEAKAVGTARDEIKRINKAGGRLQLRKSPKPEQGEWLLVGKDEGGHSLNIIGDDAFVARMLRENHPTVANVSDASARVTTEIPEGQVFNEQGLIEEIGKQNDALNEIERLRNIATEDEQATKILSRDEMVKAKARTQADMLEALYNLWNREDVRRLRLGSDAKNRVMAYGRREVVKAANDLRMAATVAADHMDNAVMISRDGETRFDAALSVLAPFQFWRSRFALQSLRRVADKPARLAWYLKLRDMQDSVHDDPIFPKRLRGMLELPMLGIPQWAGGSMFFDPLEFGTNVESVFGLNQFANTVDDSDVAQSIRALAGRGAVNADEAANAIANRKGALWEQTKQRLEQLSQSTEGLSAFSDMFRPHMPLDILWKLKTGNAADIGVLFPMTRLIRAATGVNIEQPIKAGLRQLTGNQEIPDWDAWEQYRTDRALADMVGNGEINERDALLALIERKGQYYEKAQMRAQEQMQMQTFSVFGGQLFPQGEREYYKARVTRDQLIDQAVAQLGGNPADMSYGEKTTLIKANGLDKKGTPLGDFYTTYPVYGSRQDVYAEPEGRMKGFLTDEMWTHYNSLSALDKRKVKNENKDLASFINNPERDYAAVTIDQMGTFVKTLRGYLPASDLTPKIGNVNQISYATPDQSARYQNILDTQKQYFNLDAMQPKLDTYSNLSTNDKRAYRVANPEVDAYFKWYGEQMRANPDVSKILNPDYQQSAGNFYDSQAATNSVMRQVSSNVNYMVRRIGDDTARRYHAQGGATVKGKPMVLSAKVRAALMARRKNPGYFIPRDAYAELLALFRKDNNGIPNFNRWLEMLLAGGL